MSSEKMKLRWKRTKKVSELWTLCKYLLTEKINKLIEWINLNYTSLLVDNFIISFILTLRNVLLQKILITNCKLI